VKKLSSEDCIFFTKKEQENDENRMGWGDCEFSGTCLRVYYFMMIIIDADVSI
jgi:hypothetical protein